MPPEVEGVAGPFLTDPARIHIANADKPSIEQLFLEAPRDEKPHLLASVLRQFRPESTLVFVNTKVAGRELTAELERLGFCARDLSGDLEQRERDEVMALFVGRCLPIVVATDVASRGLDIAKLDLVVNYELSPDPEVHIHRVGRTGRAGEVGLAVSLVAPHEVALLRRVEELTGGRFPWTAKLLEDKVGEPPVSRFVMFRFFDGKKDKLRAGDVLGALTAGLGLTREQVGTIKVTEWGTWVAVLREVETIVEQGLPSLTIKGKYRRAFRVG